MLWLRPLPWSWISFFFGCQRFLGGRMCINIKQWTGLRDGKITTSIEIKFGRHMHIVTSQAYNEWDDFMRSLRGVLMQVKSGLHLYWSLWQCCLKIALLVCCQISPHLLNKKKMYDRRPHCSIHRHGIVLYRSCVDKFEKLYVRLEAKK